MFDEPHWLIVSIIGAMLGFLMPYIWKILVFGIRRLSRHHLEGLWYGYYFIIENEAPKLGSETLKIQKGIFHSFVVEGESLNGAISIQQKYKGIVDEERNFLIIQMKPTKHDEHIFIRLKLPIPGNDKFMYGLWSAIDFDGNAAVGPMIMSRKELSKAELEQIRDRIHLIPEMRFMRVM
jgi:hypothetical protein